MKHIKHYAMVLRMAKQYFARERRETKKQLALAERVLADPANKDPRGEYYRYPEGGPHADDVLYADMPKRLKSYLKSLDKYEAEWLARIERADKAGKLQSMHISVEWRKSRTWGANPTAEIWLCHTDGNAYAKSASIGGCGYDKESTAVSEAISKLPPDALAVLDQMVFEGGSRLWEAYVFDRRPVPHLQFSGKGMSTFTGLFPYMNCKAGFRKDYPLPQFTIESDTRASMHNAYHIYPRRVLR